jgi:cytochrome c5
MHRIMSPALLTTLLVVAGNATAQTERLEEGRLAFEKHCSKCHENTATDAPTARDAGDWEERSELWEAVLFEHAQKGYLEMPAKGGAGDASDYEVEAAAEYMLTITHPEMPHD